MTWQQKDQLARDAANAVRGSAGGCSVIVMIDDGDNPVSIGAAVQTVAECLELLRGAADSMQEGRARVRVRAPRLMTKPKKGKN